MAKEKGSRLIANNKKAYHDYFIEETYEAGIALHGTEVKSLRMGKCSIKESFVRIENEEVYIYGMHISPYEKGNIFRHDLIQIPNLEISLCFPSLVFLGNILSLIIQFFSFCKANLHFYQAPVKIHF